MKSRQTDRRVYLSEPALSLWASPGYFYWPISRPVFSNHCHPILCLSLSLLLSHLSVYLTVLSVYLVKHRLYFFFVFNTRNAIFLFAEIKARKGRKNTEIFGLLLFVLIENPTMVVTAWVMWQNIALLRHEQMISKKQISVEVNEVHLINQLSPKTCT